ncbi:MAG: fumarate hydratase [Deferribacterales bacterium]|nr:fumarate hydratase [Deferribacterales bacterium]
MELKPHILEMIRLSTSDLSDDVVQAISSAVNVEDEGSAAQNALKTILENIRLAKEQSTPICQDTGALIFYVDYPTGGKEKDYITPIEEAVKEATAKQYLRPNSVDPVTGKNTGNNVGVNAPYIHFHQWDNDYVRIRFMQKGGGCENCGTQYKLPDIPLHAGRDLKGVRKVVLDAINAAQGQGCAPGIIGVGIGGDRALSHSLAKEQLFRKLGERNENPEIAKLETELLADINKLGIGPMGFGGKTTALDVLIGVQNRHPATYYVSIAYMCWSNRRKSIIIKGNEVTYA